MYWLFFGDKWLCRKGGVVVIGICSIGIVEGEFFVIQFFFLVDFYVEQVNFMCFFYQDFNVGYFVYLIIFFGEVKVKFVGKVGVVFIFYVYVQFMVVRNILIFFDLVQCFDGVFGQCNGSLFYFNIVYIWISCFKFRVNLYSKFMCYVIIY